MLEKSWAKYFADEIFPKIGEKPYAENGDKQGGCLLVSENELDKSRMTWQNITANLIENQPKPFCWFLFLILCHLNDLKNENMLDLLYHLYERIVKYKLTHFSGGYNRTKENKYFSKTDESL